MLVGQIGSGHNIGVTNTGPKDLAEDTMHIWTSAMLNGRRCAVSA